MTIPAIATRETHLIPSQGSSELHDVINWLAPRLEEHAGAPGLLQLTAPAPIGDPECLLEASKRPLFDLPELAPLGDEAVFWHPPDGPAVAGVGAAASWNLNGPSRFRALQDATAPLWSTLQRQEHPHCEPVSPRLYGGFAFAPGAAAQDPWQDFGDGAFVLPRWTYRRHDGKAQLSLTLRGGEVANGEQRHAWLQAWQGLWDVLASGNREPTAMPRVLGIERGSKEDFEAQVEAIRQAIGQGDFAKIVTAGRSRVQLADPLEIDGVLRRLRRARSVTRFAFRREGGTFLGVTPERLLSRRGLHIGTEALAGSIASGGEHAAQLLSSGKDQEEHQLVVDAIVQCLEPLCERFDVASEPRIRELRDVLHLHTPVSGRLAQPLHVLELVERLHPTPAVGGVPTADALSWISHHEPEPRGWYAAPVGWFDDAGDGDFAVALRSCMVRGDEAFLYAGAGIVQDSDPALEYTETELKKQALLTVLGA